MKFLSSLVGGCCLLGAMVTTAVASPITWNIPTLSYVFVSTAGTVSGVFTYDADTNTYSNWNIDISGFPDSVVNGIETPATSVITSLSSALFFDFTYASGDAELLVGFNAPLTDAGGSVPGESSVFDTPIFTSWHTDIVPVVAFSAPEPMPAMLVLLGAACAFAFGSWRRRARPSR